jgi:hypothetical protein
MINIDAPTMPAAAPVRLATPMQTQRRFAGSWRPANACCFTRDPVGRLARPGNATARITNKRSASWGPRGFPDNQHPGGGIDGSHRRHQGVAHGSG